MSQDAMSKHAAGDDQFEQAFFQLAYDKLQGKLYNLLPYLVGFEIVRKEEDNTKALGVFGFKSGNGQILFVPVFFINGKIKDLNLLYSRNTNQFYPLSEDFAEIFLRDDASNLGSVSHENKQQVMKNTPAVNYRDLVIPPRTGKYSIASVLDYIGEGNAEVKQAAWAMMEDYPEFNEALHNVYSQEEIAKAFLKKAEFVNPSKVQLVELGNAEAKSLPDDSKTKLMNKGFTFADNRKTHEQSRFGEIQYLSTFYNPESPGFYQYVTNTGNLKSGLVLLNPVNFFKEYPMEGTIVVCLDKDLLGKAYFSSAPIYVKGKVDSKEFAKVHKLLEDPAEAKPRFGTTYILINEDLKCSVPFTVTKNDKDSNGIRRIGISVQYGFNCPCCEVTEFEPTARDWPGNNYYQSRRYNNALLVLTKKVGTKFEQSGEVVYVPAGFKLLEVEFSSYISANYPVDASPEDRKKFNEKIEKAENEYKVGVPGRLSHVSILLREQGVLPMSVKMNGSDYYVTVGELTHKYVNSTKAKIGMVINHGFSENDADKLIDSVKEWKTLKGQVKLGYTGDYTMPLQDETPGSDEMGNLVYYGVPYQQTNTQDETYQGNPLQLGLGTKSEMSQVQQNVQQASDLARLGQKEIFDTHAIATITKYVDPSSKILDYVPDFVGTLDKLGRMLFMLYWETDKFEKMYGHDDLPELVELIKNVFKNLGDLVIFMKRKFPDISINNNEQAMEQV